MLRTTVLFNLQAGCIHSSNKRRAEGASFQIDIEIILYVNFNEFVFAISNLRAWKTLLIMVERSAPDANPISSAHNNKVSPNIYI